MVFKTRGVWYLKLQHKRWYCTHNFSFKKYICQNHVFKATRNWFFLHAFYTILAVKWKYNKAATNSFEKLFSVDKNEWRKNVLPNGIKPNQLIMPRENRKIEITYTSLEVSYCFFLIHSSGVVLKRTEN